MNLFYCPRCRRYLSEVCVSVPVTIRVRAMVQDIEKRILPNLTDTRDWFEHGVPWNSVDTATCIECGEHLYTWIVEECPHDWQAKEFDATQRVCTLCGVERKGKVVFDE